MAKSNTKKIINNSNSIILLIISIILFILAIILWYIYNKFSSINTPNSSLNTSFGIVDYGMGIPRNNLVELDYNVLNNPLVPPINLTQQDYGFFMPSNIATVSTNNTYRQFGILSNMNVDDDKTKILPLMGRLLLTNRGKYQYYTMANQYNNVKLPILVQNRSGLNENGVEQIYDGDTVFVQGYDQPFKVTLYENSSFQYVPVAL